MPTLEWKNWSGRSSCHPRRIVAPSNESELCALLSDSSLGDCTVRACGNGHSFSPVVITNGIVLDLGAISGIERIDVEARSAWVRGGTSLYTLGEPLQRAGLALANMGDIDRQTLAGAVATGTHGTGATLPSIAGAVRAFRMVTAAGELVEWSRDSAVHFQGAVSVLGSLGVFTALELDLVPTFRLRERMWWAWTTDCLDQLDDLIASNRHFEFFWYPIPDACEMKALSATDDQTYDRRESGGDRVDWSWRIFPTERTFRFNEMEYAVAASDGPDCFRAVADQIRKHFPKLVWPVEYRTMAADELWLSQAYGRDVVTISVHEDARRDCEELFRSVEPIFREFGGRPHLGKVHFQTGRELRDVYPKWGDFVALRQSFDPRGRFLNDHLRALFDPS